MIEQLISFVLLLIIGSIVINGFFLTTRGSIETQPDGTKKKTGSIFKAWQLFWEQKGEPIRVQYIGEQLFLKMDLLCNAARKFGYVGKFVLHESFIEVDKKFGEVIQRVEYQTELKVVYSDNKVTIFKEEDNYVFPELIRNPMASCVTCLASVYGSIIYWGIILLSSEKFFEWSKYPVAAMVVTWVFYCFSLAYLNTFFYKRIN